MFKVRIRYQEDDMVWRETSYTSPHEVTDEFLVEFFGLDECNDYEIIR